MPSLLAQTASPEAPNEADVSQPADALTARAAAAGAFDSLFLGLGVVALFVGAVGVAKLVTRPDGLHVASGGEGPSMLRQIGTR